MAENPAGSEAAARTAMRDVAPGPAPIDAYRPPQMARLVAEAGVAKAAMPAVPTLVLGLLGGAFIAFGAVFYTVAIAGSTLGFGPTRLVGGLVFSMGLVLVVVGGGELFTGNNLIVMAWAQRLIGLRALLRNWALVYAGNLAGAVALAAAVAASGVLRMGDGEPMAETVAIAQAKVALPIVEAFVRAVLCNVLVCLAVWLCFAARDVAGKILAIALPISAFVALGFEHSVANMYVLPLAMMLGAEGVDAAGVVRNLLVVTAGNVVGGGGLVALVYWLVYLRGRG